MKKTVIYLSVILYGMVLLSCSEKEGVKGENGKKGSSLLYASTRADNEDDDDLVSTSNGITDFLEDEFIADFSLIYISQRGLNNIEPAFGDPDSDNLYTYVYYDNPAANWESGYNFAPAGDRELDWENIKNIGTIGNSYVLFSMYFPEDNKVRFEVEADQSNLSNLRKSNVMAARHTTDELDSRLTFRFYHLMAFLNVSLYLPVYDETDNSGFLENALDQGDILNINRFFRIDYSANVGVDQSPAVVIPENRLEDIRMYVHPGSQETTINVSDFYPNAEVETDRVRKYTLSAMFPAGQNILQGDFLRFGVHTPGGTVKKYVFSPSVQSISLQIEKGSVTQLGLYLPRHDNNTIIVNAEILDWNKSSSSMNLVEETLNN